MAKIAEKETPRRNSAVHTNQLFNEKVLRCSRQEGIMCVGVGDAALVAMGIRYIYPKQGDRYRAACVFRSLDKA